MTFADKFRERYRTALHAARANDQDATLTGLAELYRLFAEQYSLQNGDSIVTKAQLSYWQDVFGGYIDLIRKNGLQDRRVRKFFGLIEDDSAPSFSDILRGDALPAAEAGSGSALGAGDGLGGFSDVQSPTEPSFGAKRAVGDDAGDPSGGDTEEIIPVVPPATEGLVPDLPPETGIQSPVAPVGSVGGTGGGEGKPIFDPDTLDGFIGQQHIVKVLKKEIAIANAEGRRYLDNILLFGNPGLGKSTLMRLVAKALGVRFEWMDCSQYRNSKQSLKALQNFLLKVARENEPVVIAFDEIHMLTEDLQSSLLTLLNSRVYVSPPDINGVVKRIPIEQFTFIGATTDDDKVIGTLKDRCLRLTFQMKDYTQEELKRIYRNKVASKGLTITDDAIETCIPRSRGSIRYVNAFVEGLDKALYDDEGHRVSTNIDLDVAKRYFAEKGIDEIGLSEKDLEILREIPAEENGAISAESLAARVGLDPKKYLSEYEPYLDKIKFLTKSNRGRSLTEAAINYLKSKEE